MKKQESKKLVFFFQQNVPMRQLKIDHLLIFLFFPSLKRSKPTLPLMRNKQLIIDGLCRRKKNSSPPPWHVQTNGYCLVLSIENQIVQT